MRDGFRDYVRFAPCVDDVKPVKHGCFQFQQTRWITDRPDCIELVDKKIIFGGTKRLDDEHKSLSRHRHGNIGTTN